MERPILTHFHNYEEICAYLKKAQAEYPELMQLNELATTEEGRVIWGVTLSKGNPEENPALYVQGGVHAQEGMGITCSLNFLWTVLQNPSVLDNLTIYIVPCVNPDGSNQCVTTGVNVRSKLERVYGVPNAIVPQDLDGDGKILSMRWEDPDGEWVDYPECGGVMVRRSPADTEGPFYKVYTEGMIENYDGGELNLGYRDLDFNRQYAMNWADNPNGGDFPANHVEPRTVMNFLSEHPNIFTVIDIHCGTRALIYSDPANVADARLMRKLAFMCRDITGIPPITHSRYGKAADIPSSSNLRGHIDDYCFAALGIPSVTVELGNGFNTAGMTSQEVFDASIYTKKYISLVAKMHADKGGKIAEPWKPFKHPQLGDIEVGGQFHYNAYFMDPDDMLDLIPKVADYCLEVAKLSPVLKLTKVTCDAVGDNIYRIRASVLNNSRMNTKIFESGSSHHTDRDFVLFQITGCEEILSKDTSPMVSSLYAMENRTVEWFVRAKSGDSLTVKVSHPKAVNATATVVIP